MALRILSIVAVLALCFASAQAAGTPKEISIPDGTLVGEDTGKALIFKGIPFAQPPVGDLRWAATVQNKPWTGKRQATEFGAGCPQSCSLPPHNCPAEQSEDCLFLDVYVPREGSGPFPVMLFFPGGRFEQGTAGTLLYNGQWQANNTGIIQIATNYRLGALGFLYSGVDGVEGNFAIQDQQMALKWIQRNIAALGGDPTSVTIWGQSAGGSSTATHLVSPASSGLFHRAIQDSNPIGLAFLTPTQALATADVLAKDLGCSAGAVDTICLRNAEWQNVVAAQVKAQGKLHITNIWQSFYPWTPTIKTALVPQQPLEALMAGSQANKVPYLAGHVQNEGWLFVYELFGKRASWLEFNLLVDALFPENHKKVKQMYPANPTGQDQRSALAPLATDYLFVCPIRAAARGQAKSGLPVFLYNFDHVSSFNSVAWGANYTFCDSVVCHGSELPYAFAIENDQNDVSFNANEILLAQQLASAWAQFARTSNPNGGTVSVGLEWPAYNATDSLMLGWQTPQNKLISEYRSAKCDVWDTIGYQPQKSQNN